jgi:DNA-binding transcriptional LysR family regulator
MGELELVQTNSPTAGLLEGRCDVAFLRQAVVDLRLDSVVIGEERRVAVLADDHPLAEATELRLQDFRDHVVALDSATGTTHEDLWTDAWRPVGFKLVRGVDEWLTLIGSGRAAGMSSEATAAQHPRPGIVFRPVVDAPVITVRLAWWRATAPPRLAPLVALLREAYDLAEGS